MTFKLDQTTFQEIIHNYPTLLKNQSLFAEMKKEIVHQKIYSLTVRILQEINLKDAGGDKGYVLSFNLLKEDQKFLLSIACDIIQQKFAICHQILLGMHYCFAWGEKNYRQERVIR